MFVAVTHRQRQPGALLSCTQRGAPSRQQQRGQSVFILSQADRVSSAPPTLASHSQEGPELMLHPPLLGEVGVQTLEFGFQQVTEIRRRISPLPPNLLLKIISFMDLGLHVLFCQRYMVPQGWGAVGFITEGWERKHQLLSTY